MSLENLSKFFKKNAVVIVQVSVLLLPFIIFAFYYSTSENADVVDVPTIEKVEAVAVEAVEKVKTAEKSESEIKTEQKKTLEPPTTFEVDEVSRNMLDSSTKNPHEALSENGACVTSENVKTLSKHTGTISKAKNIDQFKKPLPAMITEVEYTCVDSKGEKKTKSTTMGVAVDAEANVLRCIQSNSDPAMNSEERFKHVVKIMAHHCGFKLSEHTSLVKP
jgi:hypothetical protein